MGEKMKFRVKEWERKRNKGKYRDVFNDIGLWDVQLEGSGDNQFATLKSNKKTINIHGIFMFKVEEKYLSFNGFVQEQELRYVQFRLYNE